MPNLKENEVLVPLSRDRIVVIDMNPLSANGRALTGVGQYNAVLMAHRNDGKILTLEEDSRVLDYAKRHRAEPKMQKLLYTMLEKERYTSTQVIIGEDNIYTVFNLVAYSNYLVGSTKKAGTPKQISKNSGYVHKIDKETGLPTEISDKPNSELSNLFFEAPNGLNLSAAIRLPGNKLSLKHRPHASLEVCIILAKNVIL